MALLVAMAAILRRRKDLGIKKLTRIRRRVGRQKRILLPVAIVVLRSDLLGVLVPRCCSLVRFAARLHSPRNEHRHTGQSNPANQDQRSHSVSISRRKSWHFLMIPHCCANSVRSHPSNSRRTNDSLFTNFTTH